MSDKKPVILRKSRLTGFHIIFVGHGQNMPKVPQNCILTTPCPKNSTSILYLYIVCDTLKKNQIGNEKQNCFGCLERKKKGPDLI